MVLPFDGSSIEAWQPINESDMLLTPDVGSAFLDPFTADPTIIVFCDVYDIYKKQAYERCPRSIAKALKHADESVLLMLLTLVLKMNFLCLTL